MSGCRQLAGRVVISMGAALAMLGAADRASAQPAFNTDFTPVTVDGSTLASGQAPSLLYNAGVFHLWYRDAAAAGLGTISHATSTDGVHFTTTGVLSFATNPFPSGTPPYLYYENAAVVGGSAKLIHWTYNGGDGSYPNYNYNNSVSDIGSNFGNLAITHQGPIGGGTIGQTAGSFGIVGGYWFGQCGDGRQVCRSAYSDGTPPNVGASIYPIVLDANSLFGFDANGYINNHGDVIAGQSGLDLFITVRDSGGVRHDRQVYWSGSTDSGASWSAPLGLFAVTPTLAGAAFGGNFAHPEGLWDGNRYYLYVSSQDAAGAFLLAVTASGGAPLIAVPALSLAGLGALVLVIAALGFVVARRV